MASYVRFVVHQKDGDSGRRQGLFRALFEAEEAGLLYDWLRDSAKEHMAYMRELAAILEDHDIAVDVIQTERPGFVVYEDRYQIAAEPFKDSGA